MNAKRDVSRDVPLFLFWGAGRPLLAGCLLLFAAAGCGKAPENGPQSLALHTADGLTLAAERYLPDTPHPPGVILVHREGLDRHAWDGFAERLRTAGYLTLTFDLRGHGDSRKQTGKNWDYRRFSAADWDAALADLAAAHEALVKLGARENDLAIVGEGMGATLAARYAAQEPRIQAVALISPDLDETLRKAALQLRERPLLLIAAEGDTSSATAVSAIKAESQGFCELHMYSGSAHGTDLFAASGGAFEQLLVWLDPIIGPRALEAQGGNREHGQPAQ